MPERAPTLLPCVCCRSLLGSDRVLGWLDQGGSYNHRPDRRAAILALWLEPRPSPPPPSLPPPSSPSSRRRCRRHHYTLRYRHPCRHRRLLCCPRCLPAAGRGGGWRCTHTMHCELGLALSVCAYVCTRVRADAPLQGPPSYMPAPAPSVRRLRRVRGHGAARVDRVGNRQPTHARAPPPARAPGAVPRAANHQHQQIR